MYFLHGCTEVQLSGDFPQALPRRRSEWQSHTPRHAQPFGATQPQTPTINAVLTASSAGVACALGSGSLERQYTTEGAAGNRRGFETSGPGKTWYFRYFTAHVCASVALLQPLWVSGTSLAARVFCRRCCRGSPRRRHVAVSQEQEAASSPVVRG